MATNVLRYANSGYFARRMRVGSLRQAVTMIGREATRQLCLEAVTFRFFEAAPGNGGACRGQLHVHSVLVANVAAATAQLVGIPAEGPHLAGLLHDCGKLVMPLAFGESVMDEIARAHPTGVDRSAAEWETFGIDHAYTGAVYAAQSGLDPDLVAAVAWHHGGRRGCSAPSREIACVQLANEVVGIVAGANPDGPLLDGTLAELGLGADALDTLAESAVVASMGEPLDGSGNGTIAGRMRELEELANTDELTGLSNRRHWMSVVRSAIAQGTEGHVVVCDVDYFKAINDSHGHAAGDLVLAEIAQILARHGVAGRLGGDEFAVWIAGTEPMLVTAERIVRSVAERSAGELRVSVSVGCAAARADLPTTLDAADRALYEAKAAGRGRACAATE